MYRKKLVGKFNRSQHHQQEFTLPITSEQMVRFSICKRHLTPVYNRIYATKPFFQKKLAETRFLKLFSYFREQFQKCGLIARWRHASRIQRRVKHANRINRSDGKWNFEKHLTPLPLPLPRRRDIVGRRRGQAGTGEPGGGRRGAATGKKAELSGAASQTPRHFVDASVTSHLKIFFPHIWN